MNLDQLTSIEIVKLINDEDKKVPIVIENILPIISKTVDKIVEAMNNGGRLIYAGAGTSGRLGILDASECLPTFSVSEDQVVAIIAGGERAIRHAMEGAEDNEEQGKQDILALKPSKHDVIVGIAASGRTPYTLGVMKAARQEGAAVACVVCSPHSPMEAAADFAIVAEVGPEVVTGSTRMKAGTAQKLILNMLTTASMIKLGKVYSNLMIDVMPTNEKLKERAKSIVAEITGVSIEEADVALREHGDTKIAILSLLSGATGSVLTDVLEKHHGYLRGALKELQENHKIL